MAARVVHRRLASTASSNLGTIKHQFSQQAPGFEADWARKSLGSNAKIMKWVTSRMWPVANAHALDVASGTGIFARSLATSCSHVTAFDACPEMLAQAMTAISDEPEGGVVDLCPLTFDVGDASSLPYDDCTFDLVTCRLGVHHFANPVDQVREMARVCKKGGKVVVVDIVTPELPPVDHHGHQDCAEGETEATVEAARSECNRLEILRDPSHTTMHTASGLDALLKDTEGMLHHLPPPQALALALARQKQQSRLLANPMDLEGWMDATNTPDDHRKEIVDCVLREIDEGSVPGGYRTGMSPYWSSPQHDSPDSERRLRFVHNYAVAQATKA